MSNNDYILTKSEKELFWSPEFKLNWLKRVLYYNFSSYRKIRKYLGGYWECWYIEICRSDVWLIVNKEQAYNPNYVPGCGHGTPICEYYPINFWFKTLLYRRNQGTI